MNGKKVMTGIAALIATTLLSSSASLAQEERGSAGHLNILYWQAVSILNPYLSNGDKDIHAASMVIEPLARYDENGNIVPALAAEVPTVDNGGIAEDLKSITWKLKPDLKWADGSAFTADDVAFTATYCMDPESSCVQVAKFQDVEKVEAVDDQTVRISFSTPKPHPYGIFVGSETPILQKAQFGDCLGIRAAECTEQNFNPQGTGPFKVTEFRANDVISFEANPNYREAAKPAFATATIKGGGDAASAARSVLQTGEFDYAWNLLVEPEILEQMKAAGQGTLVTAFGSSTERLDINLSDPSPTHGDKRSTLEAGPHPFMADPAVRRALSLALDRDAIVEVGYGIAGKPTCNVITAPDDYKSTNVDWCLTQNLDEANRLLDEAGWVAGSGGIREKDGVKLAILFQTTTNSVRQGTQALVKDMWRQIGVETELRNINAAVYFGGDPSSPDTTRKFYADVQMYTDNFPGTDPEAYLAKWNCENIPSPANNWLGTNYPRFCDEAYDKLVAELAQTAEPKARAEIIKSMNDLLANEGILIPLVHRGGLAGHANTLEGVRPNPWDSDLWNVADWTRAK